MFRSFVIAALVAAPFVAVSSGAAAQAVVSQADAVKVGRVLKDSAGKSVGKIDRVNPDGSVRLIMGDKFVTVPADKMTVTGDSPSTLLSKRELAGLN